MASKFVTCRKCGLAVRRISIPLTRAQSCRHHWKAIPSKSYRNDLLEPCTAECPDCARLYYPSEHDRIPCPRCGSLRPHWVFVPGVQ